MAEFKALEKHSCAACGAHAEWNAAKQAVLCPYCGTEAPAELNSDTGLVREIDLVETLRNMPEHLRGWKVEKRSVRCQSCRAIGVFDPARVGQNCQFCGSPKLVDYDEIKAPLRPQSVLPFQWEESKVRETVRRWFKSKWLAPGSFKKRALVDTLRGIYLPYWTFDAQTHSSWTAQAGHYYYTTRQVRNSDGSTRTERTRHTRWVPASGKLDHFFDDEPVPGTQGVDVDLLRRVEPFPTNDLVPYDTAYLSGFMVEHYQVVLFDAAKRARESMDGKLHSMCASAIPGDTYRGLQVQSDYQGETFKHILVPVWLMGYDYHGKTYQLLVNGYTGRMAGRYPKSPWKIAGLILLGLIIAAAVAILASRS